MLRCAVLLSQMKVLDMKMMVECLVVTKRQLVLELGVSAIGMVDQRSDKEAAH